MTNVHSADARAQQALDLRLKTVFNTANQLLGLVASGGEKERVRLAGILRRGNIPVPSPYVHGRRLDPAVWRSLDEARVLAQRSPAARLYIDRLDALELELLMIESLGDPRQIRPLASRRFGNAQEIVTGADTHRSLAQTAKELLSTVRGEPEIRTVSARGSASETPSLECRMLRMASAAGLDLSIRIEPKLCARAATGDRTIFLSGQPVGEREADRLAVHEVLGHAVAAFNARVHRLAITTVGTSGSLRDQEGVAICLEEQAGLLDGFRVRTLAARAVAADWMHSGASFGETARALFRDHGFPADESIAIAERIYRGGGVARDVMYLSGWFRVRSALYSGQATVDELRIGRVSLDDLPLLEELRQAGWIRRPVYRPSLARSLAATQSGTSFVTSPPSLVTSLTKLEAT